MQQDQQGSAEHLPLQNLQAQAGLRLKYSAIMLVQKKNKADNCKTHQAEATCACMATTI